MTYLVFTFGELSTYHCIDIGCGLNLPSFVGTIYDSRLSFIGVEVDPNRVLLAAEMAIKVLPEVNEFLERHLNVGLLYGDATKYLNLRGTHCCLIWDRAHPAEVTYTSYDSLWRCYVHPFLLVQSNCWWKERSPALCELFDTVKVLGVSEHFKFMGSGSGDTLVIAYVANPKHASEIDEAELIPPLPTNNPSVHDARSSLFHDENDSMSNHKLLRSQFLPTKSKRARKPTNVLTADKLGHLC